MTKAESKAAAILGRKGGSSKSEAKQAAARANGKKGGAPKLVRDPAGRICQYCIEDLGESIPLDVNGTCHGCGSCFGKS